jgi:hypothetical protein
MAISQEITREQITEEIDTYRGPLYEYYFKVKMTCDDCDRTGQVWVSDTRECVKVKEEFRLMHCLCGGDEVDIVTGLAVLNSEP